MRKALVIAFCFTVVMGSIALAGSTPVKVNVPFAVHAGDAVLPAGEYVLNYRYATNIELRSMDTGDSVFVLVLRTPNSRNVPDSSISFNRYGDNYFLAGLNDGDFKASLVKSGAEKKLAGQKVRGTVIASLMH